MGKITLSTLDQLMKEVYGPVFTKYWNKQVSPHFLQLDSVVGLTTSTLESFVALFKARESNSGPIGGHSWGSWSEAYQSHTLGRRCLTCGKKMMVSYEWLDHIIDSENPVEKLIKWIDELYAIWLPCPAVEIVAEGIESVIDEHIQAHEDAVKKAQQQKAAIKKLEATFGPLNSPIPENGSLPDAPPPKPPVKKFAAQKEIVIPIPHIETQYPEFTDEVLDEVEKWMHRQPDDPYFSQVGPSDYMHLMIQLARVEKPSAIALDESHPITIPTFMQLNYRLIIRRQQIIMPGDRWWMEVAVRDDSGEPILTINHEGSYNVFRKDMFQ